LIHCFVTMGRTKAKAKAILHVMEGSHTCDDNRATENVNARMWKSCFGASNNLHDFEIVVLTNSAISCISHHSVVFKTSAFAIIAEISTIDDDSTIGFVWEILPVASGDTGGSCSSEQDPVEDCYSQRLQRHHLREFVLGTSQLTLAQVSDYVHGRKDGKDGHESLIGKKYSSDINNCQRFVLEVVGRIDGLDHNQLPTTIRRFLVALAASSLAMGATGTVMCAATAVGVAPAAAPATAGPVGAARAAITVTHAVGSSVSSCGCIGTAASVSGPAAGIGIAGAAVALIGATSGAVAAAAAGGVIVMVGLAVFFVVINQVSDALIDNAVELLFVDPIKSVGKLVNDAHAAITDPHAAITGMWKAINV